MSALTHIVLVGWKPDAPGDAGEQATALVEEIAATVPGIDSIVAGPSVSTEGREGPYSWGLVIDFESPEALEVYTAHPAHLPLAALIVQHNAALSEFDVARD